MVTQTISQSSQLPHTTSAFSALSAASTTASDGLTSSAMQTPPFLTKLYQLVGDPATTEMVSWTNEDGSSFTVHKPNEFARDILPTYFKHNNFSSFVRQLNQYGFHKQNPDRWMFGHDSFRKDRPDLLKNITRRRPKQTSTIPVTQAIVTPHALTANRAVLELGNYGLEGEVKSLKRDKDVLIKELVVTRQAEEKLKIRCDSLENRVQALEHTTKQMQTFIMHYFSQVLQPYSHAMASRKRKRLPSTSDIMAQMESEEEYQTEPNGIHDAMDVVATDGQSMSDLAQMTHIAQAAATAAAAGAPSVDALRVMMQQMGVNVKRHSAAADAAATAAHQVHEQAANPRALEDCGGMGERRRITFDPATIQELPEGPASNIRNDRSPTPPSTADRAAAAAAAAVAAVAAGSNSNSKDNNTATAVAAAAAAAAAARSAINSETAAAAAAAARSPTPSTPKSVETVTPSADLVPSVKTGNIDDLDFLKDMGPTPGTSLTMEVIESALNEPMVGKADILGSESGIQGLNGHILNGMRVSSHSSNVANNAASLRTVTDNNASDDNMAMSNGTTDTASLSAVDDEEAIEQLLDMDDTALSAPLTHLPEGTDMHALAQRIENFSNIKG